MSFKNFSTTILLILISMTCVLVAAGEVQAKDARQYYISAIDKILDCCENICCLSNSRSVKLREYAKIAASKIEFIERHKNELIEKMAAIQLEPKAYKVKYFINSQFFANAR